ncbi:hypothetical protein ACFO25_03985 [Paenactinomyces guangxiensis]|uniref:Uncharacterized protein n=1 Tax=Paenactinomyces guangxiensis TaxID=1490290 RepID=A0A7W1WUX6_9BACL|nr:hypothetical protein [Paenactinomyces guangxiensis]MBA4496510.1 hypothetical protein [Paenactinomyces guangxiensis]MBH8593645.1 hypothetical protein [Paenactinomyces guangxiensis]
MHKEVVIGETDGPEEICIRCFVQYRPNRLMQVVRMVTDRGEEIHDPVFDRMQADADRRR